MTKTGQAIATQALCVLDGIGKFDAKAQRIFRDAQKLLLEALEARKLTGIEFRLVPQTQTQSSPAFRKCWMRGPRAERFSVTLVIRSGDNSAVWLYRLFVPKNSPFSVDQIAANLAEFVESYPEHIRSGSDKTDSTGTVVALFPQPSNPVSAVPEAPVVEVAPVEPLAVEAPAPTDTRPEYARLLDNPDELAILFFPLVPHLLAEVDCTSIIEAVQAVFTWQQEIVRKFVAGAENRKMLVRVGRDIGETSFTVGGALMERLFTLGVPPKDPRPETAVPPLPAETVMRVQAAPTRRDTATTSRAKFSSPVKNPGEDDLSRMVAELSRRNAELTAARQQLDILSAKRGELIGKRTRLQTSLAQTESELAELATEAASLEAKLQDPRLTKAASLQEDLLAFMKNQLDN